MRGDARGGFRSLHGAAAQGGDAGRRDPPAGRRRVTVESHLCAKITLTLLSLRSLLLARSWIRGEYRFEPLRRGGWRLEFASHDEAGGSSARGCTPKTTVYSSASASVAPKCLPYTRAPRRACPEDDEEMAARLVIYDEVGRRAMGVSEEENGDVGGAGGRGSWWG
ncbi:hypothetical protein ABZP36_025100 [Zizania latifolia]